MNPPHTPHYPPYEHPVMTPVVGPPRGQKRGYAETQAPPPSARHPSLVQVAPPQYPAPPHYGYQPRRESVHYVTQPPPPPPPQQRMIIEDSEAKRRRLNQPFAMRPVYDQQYYDRERPAYHRESIPRPMPPPTHRPSHPVPPSAPPRGSQPIIQRRDPSLTLPPLKTGAPVRPTTSPAQPPRSDTEGTIMAYPLLTKLKTLSSITPSLATPGAKSPPYEVRGIIIAVEGHDHARVEDMASSLSEQLEKEGRFYVRMFLGPDPYQAAASSRRSSPAGNGELISRANYLNFMSEWHKVNQEIVDFVTHKPGTIVEVDEQDHEMNDGPTDRPRTPPSHEKSKDAGPYDRPGTTRSPISAISPGTVERASEMTLDTPTSKSSPPKPFTDETQPLTVRMLRSRVPQAALDAREREREREERDQAKSPPPPPPPASIRPITPPPPSSPVSKPNTTVLTPDNKISDLIPVAIIPHYQLTTVDTCAIALPITDNYDPLTHWRWHATLWRGCTGPDISVVIQSNSEEEVDGSGGNAEGKKVSLVGGMRSGVPEQLARAGVNGGISTPLPAGMIHPANTTNGSTPQQQPHTHTTNSSINGSHSSTSTNVNTTTTTNAPFAVDVRLQDYRAVIVRTRSKVSLSPRRGSISMGMMSTSEEKALEKENENWEKAKRRVGFEVEEWMRR